jgi:hypothetical protein
MLVPASLPVTAADLLQLQLGIEMFQNPTEATAEAAAINAGTDTVYGYAVKLLAANISFSQVAMAVDSLMFGVTDNTTELTKLATQFLPPQGVNAVAHSFNPTVYDAEALGLALAGGNGTSNAFATNFGSLSVSAFAQAVATATGVNANAIQGFVTNWINFYTANPAAIGGLSVTLASYGAAFGDAVGVALLIPTAANLQALVPNALIDNAEQTYAVGVALALQPQHFLLQGETINLTTGIDNVIVQLNGTVVKGIANGTGATFNSQDSINGNGHTGLTFVLDDLSTGGTWTPTNLPNVTISGIQTANLDSGEAVVANTQGWTGLTQLNVDASSSGKASTITAAGTTNVAVTDGALAGTTDTVQGGANVTVTATDTAAFSAITVGSVTAPTGNVTIKETTDGAGGHAGPIAVTGSATTTTTVSVTQVLAAASDTAGDITINDVNTTVIIDGLGGAGPSHAHIVSNALTSLTVNDNQAFNSIVLINDTTATTLALSLNNNVQTVVIVDGNNQYKTINITTGAQFSAANIGDSGATALTVAGSSGLTLMGGFHELDNVASIAVSGAASLTIAAGDIPFPAFTDNAASLSITDNGTSTAGLHFAGGITDDNLTSLTLAGSNTATMELTSLTDTGTSLTVTDSYAGVVSCPTLTVVNATTESFTNTGGGFLFVDPTNTGAVLASLTLSGLVQYAAIGDAVSTGITVNGASDNASVYFRTTGALAEGKTDSFTLGNGNDTIIDPTTAGTLNITLGTGQNSVTTGTGTANVTVGAHASPDAFIVGVNASETILTSITGAQAIGVRDNINIADAATFIATAITSAQVTAAGGDPTTLDGWLKGALLAGGHKAAQHEADWFVLKSNTYIVEQSAVAGTAFGDGDTLVKLVGVFDLSNGSIASHVITL